ncbi:MAG: hypothetical protein IJL62_02710 [Clostridia bacterium]|nr:hypothetical protein [Clostridia bacterium]MBQ5991439.1 hypothetical protein [Clostridia bacterium]
MPTVTDWLMVGITAVYVIATILICLFNGKSTKATRAQLEESKRQFEEKKRLDIMPLFSIELTYRKEGSTGSLWIPHRCELGIYQSSTSMKSFYTRSGYYMLNMKNVGLGPARSINMFLEIDNRRFTDAPICIGAISAKDTYEMYMEFQGFFSSEDKTDDDIKARLVFEFLDILGNQYSQTTDLVFSLADNRLILCDDRTSDAEFVIKDYKDND